FVILALLSLIPVFAITHLPPVPLAVALIVTTFFTVFVAGRFIPAMAMITGSVAPQHRGSFMSVNSSLQQLASGVASYISGLIIGKSVSGALTNYDIVGFVAIGATFICIALSLRLRPASQVSIAAPIPAEPA
ncbi:MAG: MFS transporter, partial [Rhizobacter sp.]|nr:MFS transporter [Chlorobiales bacterium]